MRNHWRVAIVAGVPVLALVWLLYHGRMAQNEVLPDYHNFADQRALWGVPNFWNVVTNLPFLLVAMWGVRAVGSPTFFHRGMGTDCVLHSAGSGGADWPGFGLLPCLAQ